MVRIVALASLIFLIASPLKAQSVQLPLIQRIHAKVEAGNFPASLAESYKAFAAGDYELCLSALTKAEVSRPTADKPPLLKGLALQGLGKHKEAARAFQTSLAIRGASSDALLLLGLSQLALNDSTAAAQSLEEAIFFNKFQFGSAAQAHVTLAQLYLALPTPQATLAAKALAAAAAADPKSVEARITQARVAAASGDRNAAVAALRSALADEPNNPTVRLDLTEALLRDADRFLNRDDLKEALTMSSTLAADETLKGPQRRMALVQHAKALLANGKAVEAQGILAQALTEFPQDPELVGLAEQAKMEAGVMLP